MRRCGNRLPQIDAQFLQSWTLRLFSERSRWIFREHLIRCRPRRPYAIRVVSEFVKLGTNFSHERPARGREVKPINEHQKVLSRLAGFLYIRNLVSKKRRRMLIGGYDLDMSYITNRIIAMSFPSENIRAIYRNPIWEVQDVLDLRHPGHYKVYNLCAEECYDAAHFHGRVQRFPFDDNHVPPFAMIERFCKSVQSWLNQNPDNVAVIHSMAGKGRTGMMISSYLVYTGMTAKDALDLFAEKRTTNNIGVSIPSQMRYVRQWSKIRGAPTKHFTPEAQSRELIRIRLRDTVDIDSVFVVVSEMQEVPGQAYHPQREVARCYCRRVKRGRHRTSSPRYFLLAADKDGDQNTQRSGGPRIVPQMDTESSVVYRKNCLDHNFDKPVVVSGDVRIIFYERMTGGRLFYTCFNTNFIQGSIFQLRIGDLDKVSEKGSSISGIDFCVELLFGPTNSIESGSSRRL